MRVCVDFVSCLVEMPIAMFFFSGLAKRRLSAGRTAAVLLAVTAEFTVRRTFLSASPFTFEFSILLTFFISLCCSFRAYIALLLSVVLSVAAGTVEMIVSLIVTMTGRQYATATRRFICWGSSASKS